MIEVGTPTSDELIDLARNAAEPFAREVIEDPTFGALLKVQMGSGAALRIDGAPIAAAGFVETAPGHAHGWAILRAGLSRANLLTAVRVFRAKLLESGFDVVETHCSPSHPAGARWVRALGFTRSAFDIEAAGRTFNCWEWTRQNGA